MTTFVRFLGKSSYGEEKDSFYIQEIMPYLPESEMAHIGRYLPQGIQEKRQRNQDIHAALWMY